MKFNWPIFLFLIPVLSYSQVHRIDSLTKLLPSLKDSSHVDCLNKLSVEYYINALNETYENVQTGTAIAFATQAYHEATIINYKKGLGESLQNLGEIARDRGDFIAAEQYFLRSTPLFEEVHALEKYSWANVTRGWSLQLQCRFSEAELAYNRALPYYIAVDNKERQSMLFRLISYTYSSRGYDQKAFENVLKAIRITDKINDVRGVISSPENMGNLYKNAGEPENALVYFHMAAQKAMGTNPVRYTALMGKICELSHHLDSAIYYYQESVRYVNLKTTDTVIRQRALGYRSTSIGEVYMEQKKYDLAIALFNKHLPFFEKGSDRSNVMRILVDLATCYHEKKDFSAALSYAKRLFASGQQTGARPFIRDAYRLFWQVYDARKQSDSAYKYNLRYIAIKDSILSDEYRRNIALSQMKMQDEQQRTKISLLQKDQQLTQGKLSMQEEKIKSESLIRYVLIATTAAFMLIAFFIFRTNNLKRKNEKLHLEHALELQQLENKQRATEFQQQATELEMQALRAQMNPHFIFNCLSSINRYILINKTEEASDYLTKFSRLIRMALHNSEKTFIALENELEALRLYLDLERLRFKNAFSYSITFVNDIDVNAVYIPPMMIQPFAENAIWHGLMHKKGNGSLDIQLFADDKILTCVITDNGIGRNMAAQFNSRSAETNKSMGVHITAGRLALLNKSKNKHALFNIEDLTDEDSNCCGTKVTLTMPYNELTEVLV